MKSLATYSNPGAKPVTFLEKIESYDTWRLDYLCDHIVRKHHAYIYETMPVISELAHKVADEEGHIHREIIRVYQIFRRMASHITRHMMKEEKVLFPFIEQLVEASIENIKVSRPFFGTVNNPAQIMQVEHEEADADMIMIRKVTRNYTLPANASESVISLYEKLEEFEKDLLLHVHLESNILFPKAIKLEKELGLS
ncbi:MAG: hemerythrin domain-containing protein [Sphingobacteriaceae bacterium]|nr:hemerythrin domain-containing protein [Sphingobacteriaceae bacterium]